ncbi:MAG: hypothetical protein LBL57_10555 [Tannerella sp.]|nr:hypothetical protein [Tannerella sp.]
MRDKKGYERVLAEGLQQIKRYQDRKAPGSPLYLLIFEPPQQTKESPLERTYHLE